ncbi:uncharacterized protein LOC127282456 [Leptopilina boulardi]|uniref:uncharacterized protein LOC127282456 n=1 Tax=Leptopilina boulardi TaxID=63433 RepID=UPI0021F59A70|nr:uncharacterized protein LOC127282456 [Leptopilina boulardi]
MSDNPKLEFALGSEVSMGHFFKSSFARSFISNCRDSKSLDYEFLDNGTITEEPESLNKGKNSNFYSLMNFGTGNDDEEGNDSEQSRSIWKIGETSTKTMETVELEKLRKKCQVLKEENQRLQDALTANRMPRVQVIDNVFLQTQVNTLQWQLKQTESNRQMYRSLMEQVVRFLDRTRKSLDILHEKSSAKDKGRVPRSRSVHTVHIEPSPSPGASTTSSSSSESSRFTRAKSVNQISPSPSLLKDFTWSVLRRNDSIHSTTPRFKIAASKQDLNKTHDGVVYRRPKQHEHDPDLVPPEKLSQEAFRLMRTVQSLLAMRDPDLMKMTSMENNGSITLSDDHQHHNNNHHHHEMSLSMQPNNFANSTTLPETSFVSDHDSSDRGNESCNETENNNNRTICKNSTNTIDNANDNLSLLPRARRSLDATSLNSGSSKTTDDEVLTNTDNFVVVESISKRDFFTGESRSIKKIEKDVKIRPKPSNSVSSAEDESGFSSMSSFQEVGLPSAIPFSSPVKGCHTEVGLPEVPLDKVRHRRWSSTPAEIQALFKRHSGSFANSQTTTESLSVWV